MGKSRIPPRQWTDREVAILMHAENMVAAARLGTPGFDRLDAILGEWSGAHLAFLAAAFGGTGKRDRARARIMTLARRIRATPIDWRAAARARKAVA